MTTIVVIFKILFLVLIAHSCCLFVGPNLSEASSSIIASNELRPLSKFQPPGRPTRYLKQPDDGKTLSAESSRVNQKLISSPPPPPPPPPPTTTTTTSFSSPPYPAVSLEHDETRPTVSKEQDHSQQDVAAAAADDDDRTRERQPIIIASTSDELIPRTGILEVAGENVDERARGAKEKQEPKGRGEQDDQVNYAELCYLSNGGSSLTLTVNEASPVGFVIGTIEVNGDPALEGGNIDLFDDVSAPSDLSAATPSRMAGFNQSALQVAGEQQTTSASSQQVRHLALRLQRSPLGKRSTIGFHDQPDQSQTVLVAGSGAANSHQAANNNHWSAIGSVGASNARRQARLMSPAGSHPVQQHSNSSFYSLVAGGAAQLAASAAQHQQLPAAPVRLEPGTRNLILVRQLDKESAEGEQSLLINVRCSPRQAAHAAAQPVNREITTIPVRIIVTDTNDHAPEFQGPQPFVVNISETTPIETIVLRDIEAIDRDSAGPFSTIHYRVQEDPAAPHSSWLQFVNPLVPNLMVAHQLDYETQASFQLTIVAQDEGEPEPLWSSAQVQVNIIDFDDQNPRFLDEKYTLIMDEAQQNLVGQNLQVLPRNLHAEDGDLGINAPILYSFDQLSSSPPSSASAGSSDPVGSDPIFTTSSSASLSDSTADNNQQLNVNHYLHLNPSSGEIRLLRQWPSRLMMLAAAPMTLVVRATQADNKDRYTLTTLTITTIRSSSPFASPAPVPGSALSRPPSPANAPVGSPGSSSSNETLKQRSSGGQGIEFESGQVSVRVPENAPINEKIARVRARYIQYPHHDHHQRTNLAADEHQHQADQAVDVLMMSSAGEQAKRPSSGAGRLLLTSNEKRPINYQILDDQTDQFGINGLGEIFIKRTLDYESRQEFKFRVLATYLKYSDICRVQVEVLNINDNKPKFTQPQYIFHITESRLRSNFIGQVQAHDADLNDTVRYSLSGEQAHLFNIQPSTGQVSIRSNIKQLNITSCQLIVIATDSLVGQQQFTHQARLNIQIAPQLVGRSINFDNHHQAPDSKLFASRSLAESSPSSSSNSPESWLLAAAANQQTTKQQQLIHSGSSSKDLISNQRSSVATVMASLQHMVKSVNFFDMPMSSALLLSALLAFLICLLFILLISMSIHIYRRQVNKSLSRHRHQQQQLAATAAHIRQAHLAASNATNQLLSMGQPQAALTRYLHQSPTARSATNSTITTPANSNGQSPPNSLRQQVVANQHQTSILPKLTAKVSPAAGAATTRPASALSSSRLSQVGPISLEPLKTLSAQLQQRQTSNLLQQHQQLLMKQPTSLTGTGSAQLSAVSSPSPGGRRSKHSYRSTDDDDDDDDSSSVMHCGHYSINRSCRGIDSDLKLPQQENNPVATRNEEYGKQLVRISNTNSHNNSYYNNDADQDGSPGIKSYRKLPANLGSLARPQGDKFSSPTSSSSSSSSPPLPSDTSNKEGLIMTQDSAIASDGSSSSSRRDELELTITSRRRQKIDDQTIMDESRPEQSDICVPSPPLCRTGNLIRWPLGSVPQRVKKLTWDDELSNLDDEDDPRSAGECYLAPDYGGGAREKHHERNPNDSIFSNPCSPVPQPSLAASQPDSSSIIGQNNCFDYTIVESSQFQVQDALSSLVGSSLSAQHHYLQQQLAPNVDRLPPLTKTTSYLYSSNGSFHDSKRIPTKIGNNHQQQQSHQRLSTPNNQQDLVTTAVL